jgi:hypothetical protein
VKRCNDVFKFCLVSSELWSELLRIAGLKRKVWIDTSSACDQAHI